MFRWKSAVLALLALAGSALSHAGHHHDEENIVITDEQREELLRKWNQDVGLCHSFFIFPGDRPSYV